MAKSIFITYCLWLFGGIFGLHHFYLGRDRHAFVWWIYGGYFGLGWLRDLWKIPSYVEEANQSQAYLEKLTNAMKKNKKPNVGWVRFSGQMAVGNTFGYLAITAIPMEFFSEEFYTVFYSLIPAGCAVGVHLVGNIGQRQGSIKAPLIAAYATLPLYYIFGATYMFLTTLLASYAFDWYSLEWQRKPPMRKNTAKRILVLALAGFLYTSLWASSLYYNTTITDSDGNEVKLRDAVKHFMKSPMWKEFSDVIHLLYNHIRYRGISQIWKELVKYVDPSGSQNAYKVLNLTGKETNEEITAKYRKLSRLWHPDKHKEPEKKKQAQEKFIEIQEAFNVLSTMKSQRSKKNTKNRDN